MMKLGFTAEEAAAMNETQIMGNLEAFEEIVKGKPKKAYVRRKTGAAGAKARK
jgi:hypothetical protein